MTDREIDVLEKASSLIVAAFEDDKPEEAEALRIASQALKLEHEYKKKVPDKKSVDWNKYALWIISTVALLLGIIGKLIGVEIGRFLP